MELCVISNASPFRITVQFDRRPQSFSSELSRFDRNVAFASPTRNKFSIFARCSLNWELEKKKEWIHFVGIGGAGLSALAMLALKNRFDIVWSGYMDRLKDEGAQVHLGHSVSNIEKRGEFDRPDAIVVSSAIPSDNVEVLHAKAVGLPVYKRDRWLEKVTEPYNLIAVSGTHGKTTTASMLAYVLNSMGDDLTAVVGGNVPQFPGGNVLSGSGCNFVLEADEYDDCFLRLSPHVAVVTNVEWEHVDIFQDEVAVKNSFRKFLKRIRSGGQLILCGDSGDAYDLLSHERKETTSNCAASEQNSQIVLDGYSISTFGTSCFNKWQASEIRPNSRGGSDYVLYHMGRAVADISLQLPGVHNVLNSLAVIATVGALIDDQKLSHGSINSIAFHLNNFFGVSRRFELIGAIYGCHIYDDYAHHPTEVCAVLKAARQKFPLKALWVAFQPHTFSRLAAFMKDFASAFRDANRVIITEVYAAREANAWNISGRDLAISIIGPSSDYIPNLEHVVDKLAQEISAIPEKEIVVLTLGAGDITTVGPKLLRELQQLSRKTSECKFPNSNRASPQLLHSRCHQ
ncbi:hypothetical protein Sjap_020961 [Stephania japonica]|uniref:UDP-N-acetylmuramate--L-alanine ligase n=1 Tax=Stephania japonica TaxID=461633 RepID=A0AAP0HZF9_9MAGN